VGNNKKYFLLKNIIIILIIIIFPISGLLSYLFVLPYCDCIYQHEYWKNLIT